MNIALEELIREATARFGRAGIPDAEQEAQRIATLTLGVPGYDVGGHMLAGPVAAEFVDFVRRRSERIPLERIVGSVRFCGIDLLVGDGVFVPQPETEPVVQWCAAALAREGAVGPRIVDLCSGPGTIALALAHEVGDCEVHAVELSPEAFAWLKRNALRRSRAGDPAIVTHLGDIADSLHELDGSVDLVASNPPYVADNELAGVQPEVRDHDPRVAIQGGRDGLMLVRRVERVASRLLREGGLVVVEHSDRQGGSAPAVFERAGDWDDIQDHCDQEGRDRFLTARRAPRAS
jgi:release factor glutamine methyltransferase